MTAAPTRAEAPASRDTGHLRDRDRALVVPAVRPGAPGRAPRPASLRRRSVRVGHRPRVLPGHPAPGLPVRAHLRFPPGAAPRRAGPRGGRIPCPRAPPGRAGRLAGAAQRGHPPRPEPPGDPGDRGGPRGVPAHGDDAAPFRLVRAACATPRRRGPSTRTGSTPSAMPPHWRPSWPTRSSSSHSSDWVPTGLPSSGESPSS